MVRYDTILMGNFMAYPEFQQKFGSYYGDEIGWQVSGPWQTGLNMASTVGGVFGMYPVSLSASYTRKRLTGKRTQVVFSMATLPPNTDIAGS